MPGSWSVDVAGIDPTSFDLSVTNLNRTAEIAHRSPQGIVEAIAVLESESLEVLGSIRGLL